MAHIHVHGASGRVYRDSALAVLMLVVLGSSCHVPTFDLSALFAGTDR